MSTLYNCHAHIFNVKSAPNRFYGFPLAKALSVKVISKPLAWTLKKLNFLTPNKDMLKKYSAMLSIGSQRRQRDIFDRMRNAYPDHPDAKFVLLPMDMEYMGAGQSVNNYRTQLEEVAALKAEQPHRAIPFVAIDPRRPDSMKYLREFVELRGFTGIKLYPPLGYFPYDPRLKPVYEYAVSLELPVMTHCDIGGIYFRGTLDASHLKPKSMMPNAPLRDYTSHIKEKREKFCDLFTDPLNFEDVLKTPGLETLKICLAHMGSAEMIKNESYRTITPHNWYASIRKMMLSYANVYTDISYTLAFHDVWKKLREDIEDPLYRDRILFGTDFYMTIREKDEYDLHNDFLSTLSPEAVQRITVTNPKRFLSTKFYNA